MAQSSATESAASTAASASGTLGSTNGWDQFGEAFEDEAGVLPVATLLSSPDEYAGRFVRVHGTVEQVCKVKGCWMTMSGADETMRVTFKDYGFFMPLDCEGREVVLEGTFAVQTVPEAEAKHLLEDGGKHAEAAALVGDQKEMRIEATGVRMKPVGA